MTRFLFLLPSLLSATELYFEPNLGQTAPQVRFLARGAGFQAWITDQELVLKRGPEAPVRVTFAPKYAHPRKAQGLEKLPGTSSYFIGNDPAKWVRNAPSFERAKLEDVYPGIDVVFYEAKDGQGIEYDFVVKPGADPSQISIEFEKQPKRLPNGDVTLNDGKLRHSVPRVTQSDKVIAFQSKLTGRSLHFDIPAYDDTQTLTIDPVIEYATYLSGAFEDIPNGLAVDSAGATYVTGTTTSYDFPSINATGSLAYQGTAQINAFLTKIAARPTADLYRREYSVFIGSASGYTGPGWVAVGTDGSANLFLHLTGNGFPIRKAYQTTPPGTVADGYLVRILPDASDIVFATYLGGSGEEFSRAVSVDAAGNVYVAGDTGSLDFPQSKAPVRAHGGGIMDCFIAMFSGTPNNAGIYPVVFSTMFGGVGRDEIRAIAPDGKGAVYFVASGRAEGLPFRRANRTSTASRINGDDGIAGKVSLQTSTGLYDFDYLTMVGGSPGYSFANSGAVAQDGSFYVLGTDGEQGLQLQRSIDVSGPIGVTGSLCYLVRFRPTPDAQDIYRTDFSSRVPACTSVSVNPTNSNVRVVGYTAIPFPLVDPTYFPAAGYTSASMTMELSVPSQGDVRIVKSTYIEADFFTTAVWGENGDIHTLYGTYRSEPNRRVVRGYAQRAGKAGNRSAYISRLTAASQVFPYVVTSLPLRIPFTVAGSANCNPGSYVTPAGFNWPQGSVCTVTMATVAHDIGSDQDRFASWRNDATASATRTITVGSTPTGVYEALYDNYVKLNLRARFGGQLSMDKSSADGYFKRGEIITVTAVPDPGWIFDSWCCSVELLTRITNPVGRVRVGDRVTGDAYFTLAVTGKQPLQFVPVTPCRVVDTRTTPPSIPAKGTREFNIRGQCGVPSDAAAYSLNLTAVPKGTLGYLTMYPTGAAMPTVSTLNSLDGRVKANAVLMSGGGTNGAVTVYATDATDVVLDINGYFVPPQTGSLAFYTVPACRVFDSRTSSNAPTLAALSTRTIDVRAAAACNVPANAKAYSLNATVVPTGGKPFGFLRLLPTGTAVANTSTLNAVTGTVVANAAIVPAGTNGAVDAYVTESADLVLDINGYFAPPGEATALNYYPMTPCRAIDTRLPGHGSVGPPSDGSGYTVGFGFNPLMVDPPNDCMRLIPQAARAYSVNATVWPQHYPTPKAGNPVFGYLTLYWSGGLVTNTSTLNAIDGALTSNMAVVEGPSFSGFGSDYGYLIIDITGFFSY